MKKIIPLLLCALRFIHSENPVVRTPLGSIKGSILRTVLGKDIYSFRGIRYAQPPVGELRFQPPKPYGEWNGVLDASQDGPSCPQPFIRPVSEDCLRLNVYTTQLPTHHHNPRRPVIVFIHQGGFYSYTGTSNWKGPEYLLDKDVVLVTINYRLASLGFLSTGDKLAPGNNGFKDQVMALKWVKFNIASFGGNPNSVTLMGYSAGSVSIFLHLVSPMSRGLFHRGIAMSGHSNRNWQIRTHQFDLAQKQAQLLGCPDDTSANIINCLKTKSAEAIGNSLLAFFEFGFDPILLWDAVIEPDFGQTRFLTDIPAKLFQCGQFMKVPVIAGLTAEEFAGNALSVLGNDTLLKEMNDDFERVAPIAFLYDRNTPRSKFISKQLREFYLGNGPINNSSLPGLAHLYSDTIVGYGVLRNLRLIAPRNSEPVFYYRFSYRGRYSFVYLPDGQNTTYGTVHHDDLIYLFYIKEMFPKLNESLPEYEMVRTYTSLVANFAATGNPTPKATDEICTWVPFTSKNKYYLDIGNQLVMKQNLYGERYDKCEELFPLPQYNCNH